jgi:hypothetical protein
VPLKSLTSRKISADPVSAHYGNELFFRFGLLGESSVQRVSTATHALGVLVMLLGLSWAVLFVLPPARRERVRMWLTVRWPWLEALLRR